MFKEQRDIEDFSSAVYDTRRWMIVYEDDKVYVSENIGLKYLFCNMVDRCGENVVSMPLLEHIR